MADDRYPKSREELLEENESLVARLAALEIAHEQLRGALHSREAEIAALRRRKPNHVLTPDATDKFSRPARRA